MVDFNLMRQNQHPSKLKRNSLVYGVLISSLSFTYPMITVHFLFFMTVIYLMVMAMIYIVDNES